MNTNTDKRLDTLRARAALLGLELVPHGACWELIYRLGGDIHLVCIAPTLDGIEAELRASEGSPR